LKEIGVRAVAPPPGPRQVPASGGMNENHASDCAIAAVGCRREERGSRGPPRFF
jgi:hypothetical protein